MIKNQERKRSFSSKKKRMIFLLYFMAIITPFFVSKRKNSKIKYKRWNRWHTKKALTKKQKINNHIKTCRLIFILLFECVRVYDWKSMNKIISSICFVFKILNSKKKTTKTAKLERKRDQENKFKSFIFIYSTTSNIIRRGNNM